MEGRDTRTAQQRRGRSPGRTLALLGVALAALLAAPATASAGIAGLLNGQPTFAAKPGETNYVSVRVYLGIAGTGEDIWVTEFSELSGPDVEPGVGCFPDYADVRCETPAKPSVTVLLGDGNDRVDFESVRAPVAYTLDGGPGDDRLWASSPGGTGTLIGGEGNDEFWPDNAGIGDELEPPAADTVEGGPGIDRMQYVWHAGVSLSNDGVANDGRPGEGDNVGPDVEVLEGSWKDDEIRGGPGAEQIEGRGGNDVIYGGGGDDKLFGGDDADRLSGEGGDDYLEGGEGNDVLDGGGGFDSFIADDTAFAVTGNDTIRARDGVEAEPISCGPGSDVAEIDRGDKPAGDGLNVCERVVRGVAGPKIKSKSLRAKRGKVKVKLACPAGAACRGKLAIKAKKTTVAKGAYKVRAGKTKAVKAKLTGKGRALLKRTSKVKVTVELRPKGGGKVKQKAVLRG